MKFEYFEGEVFVLGPLKGAPLRHLLRGIDHFVRQFDLGMSGLPSSRGHYLLIDSTVRPVRPCLLLPRDVEAMCKETGECIEKAIVRLMETYN